jgi:dTDP-4-amino-4,6-dideoxygalactose transaminase
VTEDVSDRVLRLPFYNELSAADQQTVVDAVKAFPVAKREAAGVAGRASS